MSQFFDDTMQGLLEAIAIKDGGLPLVEKANMAAPTFVVPDVEKELIDKMINIRKEQKISQSKLAELTGNKQQVISRIENMENSPSLKTFSNIIMALGYEIRIEKKNVL